MCKLPLVNTTTNNKGLEMKTMLKITVTTMLLAVLFLVACGSDTTNRAKVVGSDGQVYSTRAKVCIDGVVYLSNVVEGGTVYTAKMNRESKVESCSSKVKDLRSEDESRE